VTLPVLRARWRASLAALAGLAPGVGCGAGTPGTEANIPLDAGAGDGWGTAVVVTDDGAEETDPWDAFVPSEYRYREIGGDWDWVVAVCGDGRLEGLDLVDGHTWVADPAPYLEWEYTMCGTCTLLAGGSVECEYDDECVSDWYVSYPEVPEGEFVDIDAGTRHVCGLSADGGIACWGLEQWESAVPPAGDYVAVAVGNVVTCTVDQEGGGACFGGSEFGLTEVPDAHFTAIDTDMSAACGLTDTGEILCWGEECSYCIPEMLDVPPGSYASVRVGNHNVFALGADGTLTCWGWDGADDCVAAQPTDQTLPPLRLVHANSYNACGVSTAEELWCWGRIGVPRPISGLCEPRA
jgi:hypothetical protein